MALEYYGKECIEKAFKSYANESFEFCFDKTDIRYQRVLAIKFIPITVIFSSIFLWYQYVQLLPSVLVLTLP